MKDYFCSVLDVRVDKGNPTLPDDISFAKTVRTVRTNIAASMLVGDFLRQVSGSPYWCVIVTVLVQAEDGTPLATYECCHECDVRAMYAPQRIPSK